MSHAIMFGQMVMGPAGSGKSTYCDAIQECAKTLRRNIIIVNLDPAAEKFLYQCHIDIRDLISVDDVMEELKLGPNGALVYCMEYLLENFDWLQDQLQDLGDDDYVLFDCPGQIELFTHLTLMNELTQKLVNEGFALLSVYLIDITFLTTERKFISGVLVALSAMINLSLPHITVLSKSDLMPDRKLINKYVKQGDDLDGLDSEVFIEEEQEDFESLSPLDKKYFHLSQNLRSLVHDYGMVSLIELNLNDEDSIRKVIYNADISIQYGENLETDDRQYNQIDEQNQDDD